MCYWAIIGGLKCLTTCQNAFFFTLILQFLFFSCSYTSAKSFASECKIKQAWCMDFTKVTCFIIWTTCQNALGCAINVSGLCCFK